MILFRKTYLFFISLFFLFSCEGLKNSAKNIFETSERMKYERSFSGDKNVLAKWQQAYAAAGNSRLEIKDPFSAVFVQDTISKHAVGYTLELKQGDLLLVETQNLPADAKVFVDFFLAESGTDQAESEMIDQGVYSQTVKQTGTYKIIIQPEIAYSENFSFRIYTQPSAGFPVAGKGNRDAQSFWGANRDGGARKHEGVDIFAKRGTPVVASVNGTVSRTGNTGLGGKQVWLRDGILGFSYYYAHLDSIMSVSGQRVKVGDTLGTVGNTGNAEGGTPHLHFGIYTMGGAVDAYPFIRKREVPAFVSGNYDSEKNIRAASNLRAGPGTDFDLAGTAGNSVSAQVLAAAGDWFHVKTADGKEGFVSKTRLD